jgi:hypothetical protein
MGSADPQPGLGFLVKLSNGYGSHAVNAITASDECKTKKNKGRQSLANIANSYS